MKIQIASDLHMELQPEGCNVSYFLTPHPDADLLVLAGDIHAGVQAIEFFKEWPVPVLYVPGNHEFYGQVWEDVRQKLKQAAVGTAVRVLDNDIYQVDGVRFVGATLWTDFAIERDRPPENSMRLAAASLLDFFEIKSRNSLSPQGKITPEQILADHYAARNWLKEHLESPFAGKTVVISHHAPHRLSVHRKYVGNPLTPAFASDLSDLLYKADLWLHGHAHDSFDYQLGRCRVVSNPAGYALNRGSRSRDGIEFENGNYNPSLLVSI